METMYKTLRLRAMNQYAGKLNPYTLKYTAYELNVSAVRLRRIEAGELVPDPQLVDDMALYYNAPELRNYYCSQVCPLRGQERLESRDLPWISDRLTSTLSTLSNSSSAIFSILEDGAIREDEWESLGIAVTTLLRISRNAKSLKLWAKREGKLSKEYKLRQRTTQGIPYAAARKQFYSRYAEAAHVLKIERTRYNAIERGMIAPTPEEVKRISDAFFAPEVCSYYCSQECAVGSETYPLLESNDLKGISLVLMTALHYLEDCQKKLDAIFADHKVTHDEEQELLNQIICLDRIIFSADSLSLWMQHTIIKQLKKLLADNQITPDEQPQFSKLIEELRQLNYSEEALKKLEEDFSHNM